MEKPAIVAMFFFDVFYACRVAGRLRTGNLVVPAPDGESAIAFVRENPAAFGLTEHPIVGHATSVRIGGPLGRVHH